MNTHYLFYKEGKDLKKILLSRHVSEKVIEQWQSGGIKPITLKIKGETIAIPKRDIVRVSPISKEDNQSGQAFMICPFGIKHPHKGKEGFEDCECSEKYDLSPIVFEMLVKRHYPKIKYSSEINEMVRNSILGVKE